MYVRMYVSMYVFFYIFFLVWPVKHMNALWSSDPRIIIFVLFNSAKFFEMNLKLWFYGVQIKVY